MLQWLFGGSNAESETQATNYNAERVGKAAFFAAYVPGNTRLGSDTNLRLYCSPTNKRGEMSEIEKQQGNILLREESSDELMYLEDKAYVFLSNGVVTPVNKETLRGFYVR